MPDIVLNPIRVSLGRPAPIGFTLEEPTPPAVNFGDVFIHGGASTWDELLDKPFERIGENLKVMNGVLSVETAPNVEQDNTKPITSAAVYTEVGNINALLALI